jgi:hypothetical protein
MEQSGSATVEGNESFISYLSISSLFTEPQPLFHSVPTVY